jgi:FkbM family methyltransferase
MKDNLLKKIVKLYYRDNSIHYILLGPMTGIKFRINKVTQLTPLYSGNEPWHQRRFKELLKKNSVVIDVGANWGLHTLYTSKLVGKIGKVIAIEPFPLAFKELKWHIAKNACQNVIALNLAIGETDEEIKLLSKNGSGEGILADCAKEINGLVNEHLVKQQKLDTVVRELKLDRVDLIKVDVEGAEHNVLKGAEQVVDKFHPVFIIDPHNPNNDLFIGKWFTAKGYRLERVNKNLPPILKTDKGWPDKEGIWGSVLAIPQNLVS